MLDRLSTEEANTFATHFRALASAYTAICDDIKSDAAHDYLASLEKLWPMSLDELAAELHAEIFNLETHAKRDAARAKRFDDFLNSRTLRYTADFCRDADIAAESIMAPTVLTYNHEQIGGLYIEDFGPPAEARTRYYLPIEREDFKSDNLADLEAHLFKWAEDQR